MKSLLKTTDFSPSEIERLFDSAEKFKRGRDAKKYLAGKSVALVFFNPSLRTRASMQIGIYELGGNAVMIEPGNTSWTLEHRENVVMDADKTEHLKEFVGVLERYVSAIGVRSFAKLENWESERTEPILSAFEKYSSKPIINLESAMHHPCQALADMLTIREKFGGRKKKVLLTWAWHPKSLPMAVPNSFALAAAQMGHDLRMAFPKGYQLDDELIREIRRQAKNNGGSVEISNDSAASFENVEVVYAKSWGGKDFYGAAAEEIEFRASLKNDWIVTEAKMEKTDEAVFMHCLPVRRNVVATDAVIDSAKSLVIAEAENRLHIQKAILAKLIK